jgi:hypothetical protein
MPIIPESICNELPVERSIASGDRLLVEGKSFDFVFLLEIPKVHVSIGTSG